jgi:hypothetical protein
MKYKLKVEDRNYEKWTTHESRSLDPVVISLDPAKEKLFDQDIFEYNSGTTTLCHSSVRKMANIPGVLELLFKLSGR